jgi:hypothetical protein
MLGVAPGMVRCDSKRSTGSPGEPAAPPLGVTCEGDGTARGISHAGNTSMSSAVAAR